MESIILQPIMTIGTGHIQPTWLANMINPKMSSRIWPQVSWNKSPVPLTISTSVLITVIALPAFAAFELMDSVLLYTRQMNELFIATSRRRSLC